MNTSIQEEMRRKDKEDIDRLMDDLCADAGIPIAETPDEELDRLMDDLHIVMGIPIAETPTELTGKQIDPPSVAVVADEETDDDEYDYVSDFPIESVLAKAYSLVQKPDLVNRIFDAMRNKPLATAAFYFRHPTARIAMLGVHFAANRLGRQAPAFRSLLGVPLTKSSFVDNKPSPAESQLSNDLQIIDVGWVIHQRLRERPGKPVRFGHTLAAENDEIDWTTVLAFVGSNDRYERKVRKMKLGEKDQLHMCKLQTSNIRDLKARVRGKKAQAEEAIQNISERPKSQIDAEGVALRVSAWEALSLTQQSPLEAAKLTQFISGNHLSSEELKCLEKDYTRMKAWIIKRLSYKFNHGWGKPSRAKAG